MTNHRKKTVPASHRGQHLQNYFVLFLGVCLLISCKRGEKHKTYVEIKISPPAKSSVHTSGSTASSFPDPSFLKDEKNPINLAWKTPEGWSERAGRGMRLATFAIKDETGSAECSLVQLPDSGGGLANNVRRWMNQLGLVIPSEQYFNTFLSQQQSFKTADNADGVLIDMTTVKTGDLTSGTSALAAVITMDNQTAFLTMFGKKPLLQKNRERFLSLARSIHKAK